MTSAPIAKIIPFSAVDGPGNRTAVFVQGCNFFCGYCHNPETRKMCTHCGDCVAGCPVGALCLHEGKVEWDEAKCIWCDACIGRCEHSSNPRVRVMTATQVLEEVRANMPFIRGYTVSGGECGLYPDFLAELMTLSKPLGLTAMLDVNGHNDIESHRRIIEMSDGIMLDIKAFDPDIHKQVTGVGNKKVLATARAAAEMGKLYELRTVVVPGIVDVEACISGMAGMLGSRVGEVGYKIIAFRPYGVRGDYARISSPAEAELEALRKQAEACGYREVVVT